MSSPSPPGSGRKATSSILTALCCIIIFPNGALSQSLKSLISLSELIASDPPTLTKGNVNIIQTGGDENSIFEGTDGEDTPICYLPYLMSFTYGYGIPDNAIGEYDGLAAILLAMEHLNTGNGTIVQEISGINQQCPLRFTTKAFDTEMQETTAVNHIISMTDRSNTDQQLLPCAILGAGASSVSIPTSLISGLRGFPQVSPLSTSSVLDDINQFKLFGRTIPNDDGTAIPLLAKLKEWNVNYLAVLHVDNAYGNAYAKGLRLHAQKEYPHLRVVTVDYVQGADNGKISEAVKLLKETEFTYFFGILYQSADADRVMEEAYKQGIAGTGKHNWIFSDSFGNAPLNRCFDVGSPLEKAYRGASMLSAVGSIPGRKSYEMLERSMQQLAEKKEDMSFLAAHFPTEYPDGKAVNHSLVIGQETFLSKPGFTVPFLYDAVVAIGLAACQLVENSDGNEYFSGEELFESFLNTTFEGTSGSIILNPETGTRDPQSASFALTNVVDDQDACAGGMKQFKGIQSDLFKSGKWESLVPHTFNDGKSDIPLDLPALEIDANYLSSGLRAVGLVLCGIVVVMSLSSSFWTFNNTKQRVVRSSQPIFLHIISAGALLMGLSIIPLTIDEGVTNEEGADKACMAFPWLLVTGFSLTFSALFTKTHRINQIMQSAAKCKRMKLTAVDVMKPMAALLLLNIIVLAIWTGVDPLERQTIVVAQDPFLRDIETYGVCNSEHSSIFFAILGVINLGSLLYAVFEAYRARNISTELQESSYIFMAMALIGFVLLLGIPVMVIARDNVAASYFVTAGLVFVVCTSILLLIFAPKVRALRRSNHHRSLREIVSRAKSNRNQWSNYSPTTTSDLSRDDGGIEIRNDLEQKEQENRELKLEIDRLLAKEKKQAKRLEALANEIDCSWHSDECEPTGYQTTDECEATGYQTADEYEPTYYQMAAYADASYYVNAPDAGAGTASNEAMSAHSNGPGASDWAASGPYVDCEQPAKSEQALPQASSKSSSYSQAAFPAEVSSVDASKEEDEALNEEISDIEQDDTEKEEDDIQKK